MRCQKGFVRGDGGFSFETQNTTTISINLNENIGMWLEVQIPSHAPYFF